MLNLSHVPLELQFFFIFFLFAVAFLYASVGHGGASGYLALMALYGFSPLIMRPTALLLNIFVSLMAFWQYYRTLNFSWTLFGALIVFSIPAAFLGGMLSLHVTIYKQLLGIFLLLPVLKYAGIFPEENQVRRQVNSLLAVLMGAAIGFFSGLLGIGGGIILSPLLLMLSWSDIKETAAISALFITVNSIAGLIGNATTGIDFSAQIVYFACTALAGGTIGSYYGASLCRSFILKRILALVLFIAAIKLLFL